MVLSRAAIVFSRLSIFLHNERMRQANESIINPVETATIQSCQSLTTMARVEMTRIIANTMSLRLS